jgi:hypothetical protein
MEKMLNGWKKSARSNTANELGNGQRRDADPSVRDSHALGALCRLAESVLALPVIKEVFEKRPRWDRLMRTIHFTAFIGALVISFATYGEGGKPSNNQTRSEMAVSKHQPMKTLKIQIVINGKVVIATLDDNPTAKDFYSLLPLKLTLDDYAATEKVAYLPRKLSRDGAPAGARPVIGDIAYYAPWGNLAIFYKDFAYSDGLIKLGKIDSGLESVIADGSLKITIEPISNSH